MDIQNCAYDDACRLVYYKGGYDCTNKNDKEICLKKHPGETIESYLDRTHPLVVVVKRRRIGNSKL